MAITIGTLIVRLKAEIAEFVSGMSKAEQINAKTVAQIKRETKAQTREAKDSLDLLANAWGIHLPRELKKAISGFEGVRQIASAALPVAGVLAFGSVIASSVIPQVKKLIEFFTELSEKQKEAAKLADEFAAKLRKAADQAKETSRALVLSGLTGGAKSGKAAEFALMDESQLRTTLALLKALREEAEKVSKETVARLVGGGPGMGGTVIEPSPLAVMAREDLQRITRDITLAETALDELRDKSGLALGGFQDDLRNAAEAAQKLREAFNASMAVVLSDLNSFDNELAKLADDPIAKVELQVQQLTNKFLDDFAKMQESARKLGIDISDQVTAQLDEAALKAAALREALMDKAATEELQKATGELGKLLKLPQLPESNVKVSLDKLAELKVAAREFGFEMSSALKTALLHGRDFKDFLKVLIVNLIEMIAQLTIAKGLQESMKGGGVGGFFSSLLGGFLGIGKRAAGGPVTAGMPYLVGERRPELFVPNTSGTILSSVPSGNTYITNNISGDMSPESEMRWMRVLKAVHKDAQNQAVRRVREDALRR